MKAAEGVEWCGTGKIGYEPTLAIAGTPATKVGASYDRDRTAISAGRPRPSSARGPRARSVEPNQKRANARRLRRPPWAPARPQPPVLLGPRWHAPGLPVRLLGPRARRGTPQRAWPKLHAPKHAGCARPAGLAAGLRLERPAPEKPPPAPARARVAIVIVRSSERGHCQPRTAAANSASSCSRKAACGGAPGGSCISADQRAPGRRWATASAQ
jgi:hypothetical protein